ncbi:MAG: hypothetical protein LBJ41_01775 [Treponema sp.]|jgi:hypothetical protein|nr:hypothetical protein [Treponema sp.]
MLRVYGNAEMGYYSGNEHGLTVAGKDGCLHNWSGGGVYTKERIPSACEQEALYRSQVSKADLYDRIVDLYSGFAGRYCIDEFRAAVADLRQHDGSLAATQWARLESMDAEIEHNHAEFQAGRAEEWLKTETLATYTSRFWYFVRTRNFADALSRLYNGRDLQSLYEDGEIEAVYEHDRAEKLAIAAQYRAMLEKPAQGNVA